MPRKAPVTETLSLRFAHLRKSAERHRFFRIIGGRGAAALLLGTALSIGGIAETMSNMQFLVQKDLDAVRVVRVKGDDSKVVADLKGNFTGNTVFKLAQILPDRYVSRELALFDQKWIATEKWVSGEKGEERDVFLEEMHRISETIRAEFFREEIPYGHLIYEKSKKYDVDPALVAAVIEQESRFRPRAKSPVGARGLMQLMPPTARETAERLGLPYQPARLYDPLLSVRLGSAYFRQVLDSFDGNVELALAGYNGGPNRIRRLWQEAGPARGLDHFVETLALEESRNYVKRILLLADSYSQLYPALAAG